MGDLEGGVPGAGTDHSALNEQVESDIKSIEGRAKEKQGAAVYGCKADIYLRDNRETMEFKGEVTRRMGKIEGAATEKDKARIEKELAVEKVKALRNSDKEKYDDLKPGQTTVAEGVRNEFGKFLDDPNITKEIYFVMKHGSKPQRIALKESIRDGIGGKLYGVTPTMVNGLVSKAVEKEKARERAEQEARERAEQEAIERKEQEERLAAEREKEKAAKVTSPPTEVTPPEGSGGKSLFAAVTEVVGSSLPGAESKEDPKPKDLPTGREEESVPVNRAGYEESREHLINKKNDIEINIGGSNPDFNLALSDITQLRAMLDELPPEIREQVRAEFNPDSLEKDLKKAEEDEARLEEEREARVEEEAEEEAAEAEEAVEVDEEEILAEVAAEAPPPTIVVTPPQAPKDEPKEEPPQAPSQDLKDEPKEEAPHVPGAGLSALNESKSEGEEVGEGLKALAAAAETPPPAEATPPPVPKDEVKEAAATEGAELIQKVMAKKDGAIAGINKTGDDISKLGQLKKDKEELRELMKSYDKLSDGDKKEFQEKLEESYPGLMEHDAGGDVKAALLSHLENEIDRESKDLRQAVRAEGAKADNLIEGIMAKKDGAIAGIKEAGDTIESIDGALAQLEKDKGELRELIKGYDELSDEAKKQFQEKLEEISPDLAGIEHAGVDVKEALLSKLESEIDKESRELRAEKQELKAEEDAGLEMTVEGEAPEADPDLDEEGGLEMTAEAKEKTKPSLDIEEGKDVSPSLDVDGEKGAKASLEGEGEGEEEELGTKAKDSDEPEKKKPLKHDSVSLDWKEMFEKLFKGLFSYLTSWGGHSILKHSEEMSELGAKKEQANKDDNLLKGEGAKPSDAKPSDAKPSDAKPSDAKASDAKASEPKLGGSSSALADKGKGTKPSDAKDDVTAPAADVTTPAADVTAPAADGTAPAVGDDSKPTTQMGISSMAGSLSRLEGILEGERNTGGPETVEGELDGPTSPTIATQAALDAKEATVTAIAEAEAEAKAANDGVGIEPVNAEPGEPDEETSRGLKM